MREEGIRKTVSTSVSRICVFCGSNAGADPAYAEAARSFGAMLAREGIGLVYGGGNVGLMGAIADAALAAGGEVIGVIPHGLARKELAHEGLSKLHVVDSMHERKALMADLSDAFVAMPGGLGTLEEVFEVITWAQLGIHDKACALLNVRKYYNGLLDFLELAVRQSLIKPEHRAMILVESDPEVLLERIRGYRPPGVEKWIGRAGR